MKIFFADDHVLVRDGIRRFLERLDDDVEVREFGDYPGVLSALQSGGRPDLVLLDLRMPGMAGLDGFVEIKKRVPDTPVVILSGNADRNDVVRAMDLGASGYILKSQSGKAMMSALQLVLSGETYFPANLIAARPEDDEAKAEPTGSPLDRLTPREREILGHLVRGASNKEIARTLDLTEITIKSHLRRVFKKIGASNRTQAVAIAFRHGVTPGA